MIILLIIICIQETQKKWKDLAFSNCQDGRRARDWTKWSVLSPPTPPKNLKHTILSNVKTECASFGQSVELQGTQMPKTFPKVEMLERALPHNVCDMLPQNHWNAWCSSHPGPLFTVVSLTLSAFQSSVNLSKAPIYLLFHMLSPSGFAENRI